MYVKNSNFVIYLVLAAVIGIGAGCLINSQDIQSKLTSGDISKASVYNNQKEDPSETVVEEKLRSDVSYLNNTKNALSLLKERMTALADLSDRTVRTCDGIAELESSLETIASLNAKSYNTSMAIDEAVAGLDQVVAGKRTPKYEQASNIAFIGFMKVENQLKAGRVFVEDASAYVQNKDPKACEEICKLVSEWTVYCTQDAILRASKDDFKYWHNKVGEVSSALALNGGESSAFDGNFEWASDFQQFSTGVEEMMKGDMRFSSDMDLAQNVFRSSAVSEFISDLDLANNMDMGGVVRNGEGMLEQALKGVSVMEVAAVRAFPASEIEMSGLVRAMDQFENVGLKNGPAGR